MNGIKPKELKLEAKNGRVEHFKLSEWHFKPVFLNGRFKIKNRNNDLFYCLTMKVLKKIEWIY